MVLITKESVYFIIMIVMLSVKRVILTSDGNAFSKTNFKLYAVDVKVNKYSNVTTATSRDACCNKCARTTGYASVSFNTDENICLLSEEVTIQISLNSEWKTYIDTADDCLSQPCLNGATCTDAIDTFTCTCEVGWEGYQCELEINKCSGNPCLNSGTCAEHLGYYTCSCVTGYMGTNCETDIDECSGNPCLSSGMCVDYVGYYTCNCVAGYTGINCDTYIYYCLSNPCIHGDCYNIIGMYSCSCHNGWDGNNCETDIDDCSGSPCLKGAVCTDHVGYFLCACAAGYYGLTCGSRYCASGWLYYNYSCYLFVNTFGNWSSYKVHYGSVWTGAHGLSPSGEFKWSNEVDVKNYFYNNWAPGQPYNGYEVNCVCLEPWHNYGWNDARCSSQFLSICEKKIVVPNRKFIF